MTRAAIIRATLIVAVILVAPAFGRDLGSPDILKLSETNHENGVAYVAVQVINDQGLTALDIPIRFGQIGDPIQLVRVDFLDRVSHWDYKHAQIDNQNKTVVLGLFAVVGRMDPSADLDIATGGNTSIANLVFQMGDSYEPSFETFTTQKPSHELTFMYYRYENNQPQVESYSPVFEVEKLAAKRSALPLAFELSQNVPNPFNADTRFTLSLAEASHYEIRIYNVAGQLVRTYKGHADAGTHSFTWNGSNKEGKPVASGVYFYRAKAGQFSETRMMMLLK